MGVGVTVDGWRSDSGWVEECGGWVERAVDGWRSDSGLVEQ